MLRESVLMEAIMEELYQRIQEVEEYIRQYRLLLIMNQNKLAKQYLIVLVEGISEILPQIVASYQQEKLAEVREDQQYWMNQLQRILDALESEDYFLQIDVLYNETLVNLELYASMIKGESAS